MSEVMTKIVKKGGGWVSLQQLTTERPLPCCPGRIAL